MTLLATYNRDGCTGRCDAKCYNASDPKCTCICGGRNHGAGEKQAIANTKELAEAWIEDWKREHPEDDARFTDFAQQLELL